uniref:Uncharacterized protein n=1 Tax=Lepeophtheirus salmonis TaxID=72036 RepID=A0A0K2U5P0_LEPSM
MDLSFNSWRKDCTSLKVHGFPLGCRIPDSLRDDKILFTLSSSSASF